jgi:uncharacterized membrane protein YphA (DoxX/SURF4 family)
MQSAFLTGRVIVGLYFLYSALNHFTSLQMMSGYAGSKGVPLPTVAVVVSGLLLAVAGICFLLGWHPRVGVAAAVLFLVPVTLMMHAFWTHTDAMARTNDMAHFMKNLALLGSTLVFLGIPEPWPLSVRDRRRVHHVPAHA